MYSDGAGYQVEIMVVVEDGKYRVDDSDQDKWEGNENGPDQSLLVFRGVGELSHRRSSYETQGEECEQVQYNADLGRCLRRVGSSRRCAASSTGNA